MIYLIGLTKSEGVKESKSHEEKTLGCVVNLFRTPLSYPSCISLLLTFFIFIFFSLPDLKYKHI
jgi:hypothetical protein